MPDSPIDPRVALRLAAAAIVDPRSARKAIRHGSAAVRGMAGERLATAMAEMNIPDPSRPEPDPRPEHRGAA